MNPVILIPARMSSTRLPGKPLALIAGRPMIAHVLERARRAGIGPAHVATDAPEIAAFLAAEGTDAVMTSPAHASGSDRIHEALGALDAQGRHDVVVNLQGDLPLIDPQAIAAVLAPLEDPAVDIATLAAEIHDERERDDPNVVKAVGTPSGPRRLRALYFTRAAAPSGDGPLLHHIGIYAYRREALSRFVALPEGALEKRERLEQLRALEAGMRIDIGLVDSVPFGVDTPADLERARAAMAGLRPGDRP